MTNNTQSYCNEDAPALQVLRVPLLGIRDADNEFSDVIKNAYRAFETKYGAVTSVELKQLNSSLKEHEHYHKTLIDLKIPDTIYRIDQDCLLLCLISIQTRRGFTSVEIKFNTCKTITCTAKQITYRGDVHAKSVTTMAQSPGSPRMLHCLLESFKGM